MSKLFQALLSGIFFTFILDFFFFLALKLNYIDPHGIDLYYNILFADNQNLIVFTILSIIWGYVIIYLGHKVALVFSILLFSSVTLLFIPSFGKEVGAQLFEKKNTTLHTKRFTYKGDIYYNGRKNITFYDYELKKVIILPKNKITQGV
jgi:MFS family permease